MSANFTETRLDKPGSKPDCMDRYGMHEGTQVHLHYPVAQLGSHKAWKGHSATRHLQHSACVLYSEHGRACKGCQGSLTSLAGSPVFTIEDASRMLEVACCRMPLPRFVASQLCHRVVQVYLCPFVHAVPVHAVRLTARLVQPGFSEVG